MRRLVLDYFRRWWWVLGIAGVLESMLGWWIARRPQGPFEFWALLVALWAGANLLSFDFKRGVLRAVAVLPLTDRQIGTSWWLATVPLPAIGLAALLFLGAGSFCHFHPGQALPTATLALTSLFSLAWLGSFFPMIFGFIRGMGKTVWEMIYNFFVNILAMLVLFGSMLVAPGATRSPVKCALLLGVGAFLTLVGWMDAQRFDPGRLVQFYRGHPELSAMGRRKFQLTPLSSTIAPGQRRPPAGYGGLRFFILSRVVRMFLWLAAMSALLALLWAWRSSPIGGHGAVIIFAGTWSLMSCGFVMVFQLLPALRHLRLLRTMPISVLGLTGTLMAVVLLPVIALGAVSAAVASLALGPAAALTFMSNYSFMLVPASLSVLLTAWLGEGKLAYTALVVVLFGSQQVQLRLQSFLHVVELPLGLAGAIAGSCVLLVLVLTPLVLASSRRAYRAGVITPGNFPFGLGG